ncbi:MAG: lamin tail domain-containing protein [Phycisphaerae bacterium]|jgi:predicted extracellular nuclease
MRNTLITVLGIIVLAAPVAASMQITEWMYKGDDGEFIEFTNTGIDPVDMTGWSFSDDARYPGDVMLSDFGTVQPGESVILCEDPAETFRANWGLVETVKVIGGNQANIGRNDEINLYDAGSLQIDRLTYGDEDFDDSIRTNGVSGNPATPATLGANDVYQWVEAELGDAFGSYTGAHGDVANPGTYVPEPTSLVLMAVAGLGLARRR